MDGGGLEYSCRKGGLSGVCMNAEQQRRGNEQERDTEGAEGLLTPARAT